MWRTLNSLCAVPLLVLVAAGASAQCIDTDTVSAVLVEFRGCTNLPNEIAAKVGNQDVTLTKTGSNWQTETDTFVVRTRQLTNIDLQNVRTPCSVKPAAHDAGACVAKYVVSCEPLFQLKVMAVPQEVPATISYERQKTTRTIESCDLRGEKTTPTLLSLGTETLRVSTKIITGAALAADLKRELFEAVAERKLSEFAQFTVNSRSTVGRSRASSSLRQLTLQNIVFIRQ